MLDNIALYMPKQPRCGRAVASYTDKSPPAGGFTFCYWVAFCVTTGAMKTTTTPDIIFASYTNLHVTIAHLQAIALTQTAINTNIIYERCQQQDIIEPNARPMVSFHVNAVLHSSLPLGLQKAKLMTHVIPLGSLMSVGTQRSMPIFIGFFNGFRDNLCRGADGSFFIFASSQTFWSAVTYGPTQSAVAYGRTIIRSCDSLWTRPSPCREVLKTLAFANTVKCLPCYTDADATLGNSAELILDDALDYTGCQHVLAMHRAKLLCGTAVPLWWVGHPAGWLHRTCWLKLTVGPVGPLGDLLIGAMLADTQKIPGLLSRAA